MACTAFKRTLELDNNEQRPTKRRRCNPFEPVKKYNSLNASNSNVFAQASNATLSSDQIAININDEIKRLHHRKQLIISPAPAEGMHDTYCNNSEIGTSSTEKVLFTYKQVQLICARMVKEQMEQLCDKYNKILTMRLAEQYDACIKFTYDQLQRSFEGAASYIS